MVKTDRIRKGDEVNVVADNGKIVAYGIAVADSDEVMKTRKGPYVKVEKPLYKTPKIRDLPEYKDGLFYSQSLPAIAVGYVVSNLGAVTAVDLNAAPGGKATHLAQMGIRVVAVDRSHPKIARMKVEVARLGVATHVDTLLHDSRYLDRDFPRLKAEVALVDPPCTDIGVRPKIYHKVTLDAAKTLAKYQIQFLETALKLAPRVVYSTCTLTHVENEDVVKRVKAELLDPGLTIGAPGWDCPECRRFLPHIHNTPGFFLSLLERR